MSAHLGVHLHPLLVMSNGIVTVPCPHGVLISVRMQSRKHRARFTACSNDCTDCGAGRRFKVGPDGKLKARARR